jgi:hypothetical protein
VSYRKQGRYISDLDRDRFTVFDNGRRVPIEIFTNEDTPLTIGLIIDASGSMGTKMNDVVSASVAFARLSNPEDELFAIRFNDDVQHVIRDRQFLLAQDLGALHAALRLMRPDGRTALYDAMVAGIDYLARGSRGRKALVVISDGGDNASEVTLERVLARARETNAAILHDGCSPRGSRPQPGRAQVSGARDRRRTLSAPLARRSDAGLRTHRPRDSQRLHDWLCPARPRRELPPRPRRRPGAELAEGQHPHAPGLFRRGAGAVSTAVATMTRELFLRWLERGLLAVGVALAAWCAVVLVRRFHNAAMPASYGSSGHRR